MKHIRVSARGIVVNENKILLNKFGNGLYYNVPGGGIEIGESARETVIREIYEETGLFTTVDSFIMLFEYEPKKCNYGFGERHAMSLFFRCQLTGSNEIKEPLIPDVSTIDESMVSEAVWVDIKALDSINLVPNINDELIEYLKVGTFSPVFYENDLKSAYKMEDVVNKINKENTNEKTS